MNEDVMRQKLAKLKTELAIKRNTSDATLIQRNIKFLETRLRKSGIERQATNYKQIQAFVVRLAGELLESELLYSIIRKKEPRTFAELQRLAIELGIKALKKRKSR